MQGFSFALAFGGALATAPASVRAEFDGLKVESDWAINRGRSEVRFLTQDGRIVQTMRGPLVEDKDEYRILCHDDEDAS